MITRDGAKMSKSKGNVVSPSEFVEPYGADTARCYILFIGPPEQGADWSDEGIGGMNRFLARLWRLAAEAAERTEPSEAPVGDPTPLLRKAHWAIELATAGPARPLRVQHRDRRGDGARQRDLPPQGRARGDRVGRHAAPLRDRHGGVAAVPVRAAPGRRGLRDDHRRARLGGAVAGGRPGAAGRGHVRAGRAGERQAARPDRGARGRVAEEQERLARQSARVLGYIDGGEVVKTVVVPGKLVNFVVRS